MSAANRDGSALVVIHNYYGNHVVTAYYRRAPIAGDFLVLPDGRKSKVIDVDLLPLPLFFDGQPDVVATLFLDAPPEVKP